MVYCDDGHVLRLVIEALVSNLKTCTHVLLAFKEAIAEVLARCCNGDDATISYARQHLHLDERCCSCSHIHCLHVEQLAPVSCNLCRHICRCKFEVHNYEAIRLGCELYKSLTIAVRGYVRDRLQAVESIACCQRNSDCCAICELEVHVGIILTNCLEDRVAIYAILTISAVCAICAILTGSLAEQLPCCTIVVRYIPVVVLDLELWSNTISTILAIYAIFTISTVLAIDTVLAILTVSAILTINTIFAILTISTTVARCSSRHLVSAIIQEPLTIDSPIVDAIGSLANTDYRSIAI